MNEKEIFKKEVVKRLKKWEKKVPDIKTKVVLSEIILEINEKPQRK